MDSSQGSEGDVFTKRSGGLTYDLAGHDSNPMVERQNLGLERLDGVDAPNGLAVPEWRCRIPLEGGAHRSS